MFESRPENSLHNLVKSTVSNLHILVRPEPALHLNIGISGIGQC